MGFRVCAYAHDTTTVDQVRSGQVNKEIDRISLRTLRWKDQTSKGAQSQTSRNNLTMEYMYRNRDSNFKSFLMQWSARKDMDWLAQKKIEETVRTTVTPHSEINNLLALIKWLK